MKIKHITITFGLVFSAWLPAQNRYSLEKCKDIALQNNRQLVNGKLQIQASEETKKEAYTNYFPTVSASGLAFRSTKPLFSGSTPALSLPLGGTAIDVPSMPFNFLKNGISNSVTMTQPLYAGGKIINGNKLAKLGIEVSKQKLHLTENQVLLQTETLYWDIVSLLEKIRTIGALQEQMNELQKDAEVSLKAGLITMNDLLQVKLKINELESTRMNIENGISISKMALCQLMGIDLENTPKFDIESPNITEPSMPQTYYVNHKQALNARVETDLLDKSVEAAKLQTKIKQGEYLPTVAVGVMYLQDKLFDKWSGAGIGFVTATIPISGWRGGSHAIKKQKLEEQIAYNNKLDGQEQLLIQIQNVKNELDNAYKQTLIARESIDQSTENYRINKDHYKNGLAKMSDLLDAQSLLQQSKDKYVDSYAAYQKKRFEYLQVTGR